MRVVKFVDGWVAFRLFVAIMTRNNSGPSDLHFHPNPPYFGLLSVVARIYAQSLLSLQLPRKFKDSVEGQQGLLFYLQYCMWTE